MFCNPEAVTFWTEGSMQYCSKYIHGLQATSLYLHFSIFFVKGYWRIDDFFHDYFIKEMCNSALCKLNAALFVNANTKKKFPTYCTIRLSHSHFKWSYFETGWNLECSDISEMSQSWLKSCQDSVDADLEDSVGSFSE